LNSGLRDHADPGLMGGLGEAFDDGLRRVGHRKHSAIRFGLQRHPARGKPGDGFFRAEPGEGSDEGFSSPWISAGKFPGIVAGVGDIAATTSRDANFG